MPGRGAQDAAPEVLVLLGPLTQDAGLVVLGLLVWVVLVAAAVGIGIHYVRTLPAASGWRPTRLTPLDVLQRQYAAGEIDRQQFDDARARLRDQPPDL